MTARDDNTGPIRRLRIDEFGMAAGNAGGPGEAPAHSGRRVVVAAGLALLVLWGVLWLTFRQWRAGYRERAAFGAAQVATAVDPLAGVVPPGTDAEAWRGAVAQTHAMLVTLTAANLLDRAQMQSLRDDIAARVARARARPETARDELAGLWDHMTERAGPILAPRHPRPKLLPPPR